MNKNKEELTEVYEAPQVTIIEVIVEKGFAVSDDVYGEMDDTGTIC